MLVYQRGVQKRRTHSKFSDFLNISLFLILARLYIKERRASKYRQIVPFGILWNISYLSVVLLSRPEKQIAYVDENDLHITVTFNS